MKTLSQLSYLTDIDVKNTTCLIFLPNKKLQLSYTYIFQTFFISLGVNVPNEKTSWHITSFNNTVR